MRRTVSPTFQGVTKRYGRYELDLEEVLRD